MIKFIIIILILIGILLIVRNIFILKDIDMRLDACSGSLFEILDLKKELLDQLIKSSKNKNNKALFDTINTEDLFEYDDALFDAFNVLKDDKTISKKKVELLKDIKSKDEEIDGLKDFYNINVNKFNSVFSKKPLNILYKVFKFQKKEAFKIRNTSDLNILKD